MQRSGATLQLTLARACAWALLVAGWVGIGSFALQFAPSVASGFAGVALWLLALGAAATVVTRGGLGRGTRAAALAAAAVITGVALLASVRGGGQGAVLLALLGWAALTALASGVVRGLRLAQPVAPQPPIAAASLGALCAALVLGDPGDLQALAARLAVFVGVVALLLIGLQRAMVGAAPLKGLPGCRAGLFDCSLPAWPVGAWRDLQQWPILLAGLAMLPMMAALPLMAAWCSALKVPPQAMVLLHIAAMFAPAWLLQGPMARWAPRTLAAVCALLLAAGAAIVMWTPAPWNLLGLAATHGAAWGLAWSGQLWAPARRAQQGASPLRAAAGYAVLTLAFGFVVGQAGLGGVAAVHALLGLAALLAWGLRLAQGQARAALPKADAAPAVLPPAQADR